MGSGDPKLTPSTHIDLPLSLQRGAGPIPWILGGNEHHVYFQTRQERKSTQRWRLRWKIPVAGAVTHLKLVVINTVIFFKNYIVCVCFLSKRRGSRRKQDAVRGKFRLRINRNGSSPRRTLSGSQLSTQGRSPGF